MYQLRQAMEIRVQTTRWSCVAAAFATVLDMDLETLIEAIGHDGSEIMFEDLPEPLCRRSFNLQELGLVLWARGYIVGHYDVEPLAIIDEDHIYNLSYENCDARFAEIMDNTVGVGCGLIRGTEKTHAFAWNGISAYDPTGFIYPLSRYELYSYHPIFPRPNF